MTNLEFKKEVELYVETLSPTVGPYEVVVFPMNAQSDETQAALVLCWVGTTDNEVIKQVYKVWFNAGVLNKALVDKTDWPINV